MIRSLFPRHQPNPAPTGFDVLEVQRAAARLFDAIVDRVQLLNGRLIAGEVDTSGRASIGIALQAGVAKRIAHGLGRPYRGGFVVRDFGANASAVREVDSDHISVTLVSATDCKIFFWVW